MSPNIKKVEQIIEKETLDVLEAGIVAGHEALKNKNFQVAEEIFTNLLAVSPENSSIHNSLAVICTARNDIRSAIDHLNSAIKLEPEHLEAIFLLGSLYVSI